MLLKPVGFQAGKRYPTLVVAHGGPAGAYVNGFRLGGLEGGQVWAGKGWAVFYPNPRGSSNYGQKTLAANVNDWGGGDFKDIMTGVDALVARGIADPDKLAHIGWSYGGYMTAWTITQTTRFKAAMVGAGLTNMWSMYGTNDIPSVLIAYFGGIPNKQTLPLYLDRSAMTHIDKVTTPTLILHGANDERVPTGQAYELYRGLKDRGKATELVFYPREGHGIAEYYHQKDRMQRIYDWVTKYTLGTGGNHDRTIASTAARRLRAGRDARSVRRRTARRFSPSWPARSARCWISTISSRRSRTSSRGSPTSRSSRSTCSNEQREELSIAYAVGYPEEIVKHFTLQGRAGHGRHRGRGAAADPAQRRRSGSALPRGGARARSRSWRCRFATRAR